MIEELKNLLLLRLKSLNNLIKSFSFWKRIILPFSLALFLFFLLYFIFYRVFYFLNKIPVLGILVSQKFLDFTLMGIFFFLALSNIVGSFSLFFEDEELSFLLRFPLKKESIFTFKFTEIILYSSWVPLIFLIPFILSYLNVFKPQNIHIFFIPFNFIFYIISAGLTGILLFYIFIKFSPVIKREFIPFFFGILFFIFIFIYFKYANPEIFRVFDAKSLKEAVRILKKAGSMSPQFLPSNWLTSNFVNAKNPFITFLLFMFYNTTLFLLLTTLPFEGLYHKSFISKGGKGGRRYRFMFLQKELKSFYRNYSQLSQFIFLLLLFILYIVSVRGKGIKIDFALWHIFITYANFTFTIYLIITIAIRFIYPLPSLEERGISLIYYTGEKPLKYFYYQLIFYFLLTFFLGLVIFVLTHFSLKVRYFRDITFFMFVSIPFILFNISFISLSTGYIMPQFEEKNPAKIASGSGAFFTAVILILYLLLSVYFLIQPPFRRFYYRENLNFTFYYLLLVIFSFIIFLIFKILLTKKLKTFEF